MAWTINIKYVTANTFHRVYLNNRYNYCWSLFIPFKQTRDWGFKTESGWVNNEEYYQKKNLSKNCLKNYA